MSNIQKILKNKISRIEAIKRVYGIEKVNKNSAVALSDGEIVTAWAVEGFETFEDLESQISLHDIEAIYDSSL